MLYLAIICLLVVGYLLIRYTPRDWYFAKGMVISLFGMVACVVTGWALAQVLAAVLM